MTHCNLMEASLGLLSIPDLGYEILLIISKLANYYTMDSMLSHHMHSNNQGDNINSDNSISKGHAHIHIIYTHTYMYVIRKVEVLVLGQNCLHTSRKSLTHSTASVTDLALVHVSWTLIEVREWCKAGDGAQHDGII